jgi:predicted neuraminidase
VVSADFSHSARANAARLVKADKLAWLFHATPGPWPSTDAERRAAERVAGVPRSSDETWELARRLLDDLQNRSSHDA